MTIRTLALACLAIAPAVALAQQPEWPATDGPGQLPERWARALSLGEPADDQEASRSSDGLKGPALGLADLEQIAQRDNPTLAQAAAAIAAAEGRYVQAGLYPNPVLTYRGDEIGDQGRGGKQGASLGQEFVTGGKLRLARAVAGHEIAQARGAYEAQRRRVLNDVRAGYYDVLIAREAARLNGQLLRVGLEGVRVAERLHAGQEASRVDVLEAQVEAETARLRLEEALSRQEAAWRRLAAVLGQPAMPPAPLRGDPTADLPSFTWEDTMSRLLAESPELARARAGVQRAQCELARQYAQRVPSLQIEATVQRDQATGDDIAGVGVGLPLPIFNRNQGNISRARAELIAAQSEARRVELSLQERLATSFQEYAASRQRVESYATKILPSARSSFELIQAGYRQGELDFVRLLTAQRTYFRASLAYLESLARLHDSSVSIEGLLLRGGLQEATPPMESAGTGPSAAGQVGGIGD